MNVQNIPREDKVIKTAIIPKLDCLFFADYPNIEAKVLAFYLKKLSYPEMADFFVNDAEGDLHKLTASLMYGVPVSEVTEAQRQKAKTLNFSIIFGGGSKTLIKQKAAKDYDEATEMLIAFHTAWPGIGWDSPIKRKLGLSTEAAPGTLVWWISKKVEDRGYITTLWGRHLHPRAAHSALNALVQGCAADLLKWALIEIWEHLKYHKFESHLVNQVHDEVTIDAKKAELVALVRAVPELMTYAPLQDVVPIRPEPEVSYTTWADKEEYTCSH